MIRGLLLTALMLTAPATIAKEPNTEHTFKLGDASPAPARINDARMLIGAWAGEGFGQRFEETWNAPSAGTMVGMFKVFDEEKGISFYELMVIEEVGESLVLKVKHFNADFTGWEEKDDYVSMPLVDRNESELHFAGLSFYRQNADELHAFVALGSAQGTNEEKLVYRRVLGLR